MMRRLKEENRRLRSEEREYAGGEDFELQIALQNSGKGYAAAEQGEEEMTYEEMLAIGESMGTVPTGLSSATLSRLPHIFYRRGKASNETCTVCMVDLKEREDVVELPQCKHLYHPGCIKPWLEGKKTCPMCLVEVKWQ